MLFKNITIIDENIEVKENMFVAVKDDKIVYVGDKEPAGEYGRVYDGKGKLLMSAFYNAHGHSPMTLLRGYGENMNLQDWLFTKIFPFEDHLNSDAVYSGQMLAIAESVKNGIVSTSDMYYFTDDMVKAVSEAKAKSNISRSISISETEKVFELPKIKDIYRTAKAYNGMDNGRIKIDASAHSEYTNSPEAIAEVVKFSKENNLIFHVHVSETKTEHEECKARHNMTPIELMDSLGAWDQPSLLAHCVWVEEHDFEIMKKKGVYVAANPISNLKLASGVSNVPKMLEMGINVALGTDSVCSNNSLNFFEEMKAFATVSKMYYKDPTVVTPKQAIYAATRAGALAQGRSDCGLIKEGFKADLIVVDIDQPNMVPVHNLLNNIVYSAEAGDIKMTMCDGTVLYEDGEYKTLDIEKTKSQVIENTNKILAEL